MDTDGCTTDGNGKRGRKTKINGAEARAKKIEINGTGDGSEDDSWNSSLPVKCRSTESLDRASSLPVFMFMSPLSSTASSSSGCTTVSSRGGLLWSAAAAVEAGAGARPCIWTTHDSSFRGKERSTRGGG